MPKYAAACSRFRWEYQERQEMKRERERERERERAGQKGGKGRASKYIANLVAKKEGACTRVCRSVRIFHTSEMDTDG